MAATDIDKSFARLLKLAKELKLERVEVGTTYDSAPALGVNDRPFASIKEAGVMVLHC